MQSANVPEDGNQNSFPAVFRSPLRNFWKAVGNKRRKVEKMSARAMNPPASHLAYVVETGGGPNSSAASTNTVRFSGGTRGATEHALDKI